MAKPRRKQAQPESKRVLIIFLVFFMLTTIGGGFFGYQGYIDSEGKDGKIKTEKGLAEKAASEREFYKYQALLYRRLMGQEKMAAKADLDKMHDAFDKANPVLGAKADNSVGWTQHEDRNEVYKLIEEVNRRLKIGAPDADELPVLKNWVDDLTKRLQAAPAEKQTVTNKNYEDALKYQMVQAERAKNDIRPFLVAKEDEKARAANAESQLKTEKDIFLKNNKDVEAKLAENRKEQDDSKKKLEEEITRLSNELAKATKALAEAGKKQQADLAVKDKAIVDLSKRVEFLEGEQAKLKLKDIEVPDLQLRAVGRVVDRKGESAFINLGQAHKMTQQMTFSIHSAGPDGQPLPTSKGSMEVVYVFESGSQGRILLEKSKSDPIQTGDLIVNPNWNPDRKKHVALSGIADLSGEGRNQLREFRQLLERQNIVLDAFLEPRDNDWVLQGKGITRETNYLILGEELPDSKELAETARNMQKQNAELLKIARQNGVFIVSMRNYLDMIGYQPPRGLGESDYRPILTSQPEKKDPAPVPPKEGDKMELKPKDGDKPKDADKMEAKPKDMDKMEAKPK